MADEKRERYINPYTDFGCRDIVNAINTAKKEAKEEGRDERTLEIARRMKSKGKSVEEIAEMTDLPVDEISRL